MRRNTVAEPIKNIRMKVEDPPFSLRTAGLYASPIRSGKIKNETELVKKKGADFSTFRAFFK